MPKAAITCEQPDPGFRQDMIVLVKRQPPYQDKPERVRRLVLSYAEARDAYAALATALNDVGQLHPQR